MLFARAWSVGPSFACFAQCTPVAAPVAPPPKPHSVIIPWPRSHHKRVMCNSLRLLSYIGLWPEGGPAEPRPPLRLRLRVVVLCVGRENGAGLCIAALCLGFFQMACSKGRRTVTHLGGARPHSAQEIPFPVTRPVLIYGLRGPEGRGLLLNILFGPF